jgi:hypothetical protein
MFRILTVSAVSLFLSVGISLNTQASPDNSAEAQARIIFYRAGESSKTRRINFDALINGDKVERLKYGKPVLALVDAGEYQLSASINGTSALVVSLEPGQTYYVHAGLRRLGQTTKSSLVIVEKHVALTQQPAIEAAI